jgi:hypothetical protein
VKNSNIIDYIIVIKNALSNEICDEILNEFINSDEWADTVVGNKGELNKNITKLPDYWYILPTRYTEQIKILDIN